jgi:HIRAN domain-containing protein
MSVLDWFRSLVGSSEPARIPPEQIGSERIAPKPVRPPEPEGFRQYTIHVAGVSFRQRAVARVCEGERLLLEPEPTNRRDKNAIKVCRIDGEHIGYLPREVAERVAPDATHRWRPLDPDVQITALLYGGDIRCVMLHVLIPTKPRSARKVVSAKS